MKIRNKNIQNKLLKKTFKKIRQLLNVLSSKQENLLILYLEIFFIVLEKFLFNNFFNVFF